MSKAVTTRSGWAKNPNLDRFPSHRSRAGVTVMPGKNDSVSAHTSWIPSALRAMFPSRVPKPRNGLVTVTSRDMLGVKRMWKNNMPAPLGLEQKLTAHFSSVRMAEKMDLVLWAQNFDRFLALPAEPQTPAAGQKKRIVLASEAAIILFSGRCVARATPLAYIRDGEEEKTVSYLRMFIESLPQYLSDSAKDSLQEDITAIGELMKANKEVPART